MPVDVLAWAAGAVVVVVVSGLHAEVDEFVPVLVWAVEAPDPDCVPDDVFVPVWAVDAPELAWLVDVVFVLVWALELPDPAWLPAFEVVPVCAVGAGEQAGVPVDEPVPVCVDVLPVAGWAGVLLLGEGVDVDVLVVWSVEVPPLEPWSAGAGVAVHLVV